MKREPREVKPELTPYTVDGVTYHQATLRDPFGRAVYVSIKTDKQNALKLAVAFLKRAAGRYVLATV